MKKIGKLSINPEKVIKNKELINLKGGVYANCGDYESLCLASACIKSDLSIGECKWGWIGSKLSCTCQ